MARPTRPDPSNHADPHRGPSGPLRRGWTTGACAAAAAGAAARVLFHGDSPDPIEIPFPDGRRVAFAVAQLRRAADGAEAAVVKDAGDDPDVTHGAMVWATVRLLPPGGGLVFRAGIGVGTITRPGLPLPPGEPAINPVPRRMIAAALAEAAGTPEPPDATVTISIPNGIALAERTLNGRLGIVGGLSILGTTGIVVPYSCAAWIDTIHRGIDVARAIGLQHVAGATGRATELAIQAAHDLPDAALIEMGDFAGGMLKYLRRFPVPRVTVAGGLAKITKLAQGLMDLHSGRGSVDLPALAALAAAAGCPPGLPAGVRDAATAAEAFAAARRFDFPLADEVAIAAWTHAAAVLAGAGIALEVVMFDRDGALRGRAPFAPADAPHPLNLRS